MKSSQEKRNCIQCNSEFIAWKSSNTCHCSNVCARKTVKEKLQRFRTGAISHCSFCNKDMYVAKWEISTKKYCSKKCQNQGLFVERIEVKCTNEFCSNVVSKTKNELDKYTERNAKIFCSVKCSNINRSQIAGSMLKHSGTKPELKFKELLDANNIEYKHQYAIPWKKGWKKWFDFYIPKYNLLIEIDGIYWHGKGKLDSELNAQQNQSRLNDIQKSKLAQNSGYNLLRIWEDELDKFNINQLLT
jgi:very-short-patch-repair endonuclease